MIAFLMILIENWPGLNWNDDLPKVVAFLIDYYERIRCELDLNEPDANIYNISRKRMHM